MILCQKCGHENTDDASFCAECGTFLEWSGQRVAPPAQALPVAGPAAAPAAETVPSSALAAEPRAASPPPSVSAKPSGPAPQQPAPQQPAPQQPAPQQPAPQQPAARPPGIPDAPAPRRPIASGTDQPGSRQPVAGSAPTRPRATNRPTSEEPPYKAGDRICPACGVGNDPARRFCRRCGNSLAEAPIAVPVTVPWYRRLFPGRTPQRYQAGDRPRSMAERGRPGRPVLAYLVTFGLMALILAAIGSYVAVPDVREQVDRTVTGLKRQLMPELADVHPSASNAAVDDDKATWWTGRGDDPGMTLRFSPAVDLGALVVHGGAGAEDFLQFRRPLRLRLVAGDQSATVDLADASDPQSKRIDLRGVSRLRVVVEEATGTPQGAPIAIRELEFKEVR